MAANHFQKWAVEEAEGFVSTKRTSDGGIDGRLYFGSSKDKELKSMGLQQNLWVGNVAYKRK